MEKDYYDRRDKSPNKEDKEEYEDQTVFLEKFSDLEEFSWEEGKQKFRTIERWDRCEVKHRKKYVDEDNKRKNLSKSRAEKLAT